MRFCKVVSMASVLTLATLSGCSNPPAVSTCIPGASLACAGLGGGSGIQLCAANGTLGACMCADAASPTVDSGSDVDSASPTPDSGTPPEDGSGPDVDAAMPPDDASTPADAGSIRGHVVMIGSAIWTPNEGWDRIFENAIFLSERGGDLRVLEYTEYSAGSGWEGHPRDVMDAAAAARGRTLTRTALTSASGLAAALATTDVLFVPWQFYTNESTLRTVGGFWHDTLVEFVDDGGVVVVVTNSTGLNGHEMRLVEGPGLFNFGGGAAGAPSGTAIAVVDATDPVAMGVLTPFPTSGEGGQCFPSSTGGALVARTSDARLCPVVRHLVR